MKTYATPSIRLLLASALLCAALPAAAGAQTSVGLAAALDHAGGAIAPDTWSDFMRTEGLTVRLDTARVERRADDGALLVWVRFEYAEPVPVPSAPEHTYSNMEIREALDCRAQRVADVEAVIRDGDERILATTRPSAVSWTTFVEHPFDTDLFILACRFLSARAS